MINLRTKFEVAIFTRYENMKGVAICRKWGGLGWLGVTQAYRQCYHSIERIRLPIRLETIGPTSVLCYLRDIAFDKYFATPLAFNASDGWDYLRKILYAGQRTRPAYTAVKKYCRSCSTAWVGCTNVTDDRRNCDIAKTRT